MKVFMTLENIEFLQATFSNQTILVNRKIDLRQSVTLPFLKAAKFIRPYSSNYHMAKYNYSSFACGDIICAQI